jgi:hypothetical protein
MISTSLDRADAVKEISNHVADRDRFVVAVSLAFFEAYAFCNGTIPSWTAYIDMGGPSVLRTTSPDLLAAQTRAALGTAVLTVPKTVPAALLGAVLGQALPEDGSRDLIDLTAGYQPALVFGALAVVNPLDAALMSAAYSAGGRPEAPEAPPASPQWAD